ncbi:Scarecrow-like protein 8 [Musa troglodytarum]|uniref:Scarecrow-like protein 8 n=1 Tax=Musa troglodytarum TaxID=320322 RepID=A0A9E7EX41_9LILI|nr:Scarecrow-like protein 8 [Musa troglodytarum]
MRNRLQELERRLLLDEEEDETSNSGSALTGAEWRGQAVQQIIFPPPPPGLAAAKKLLPSPTNSASSTVSSSASSSPPPPSFTPPRHVLLDAAASIADGNLEAAEANLAVLKRSANPRGDAEQRLTAMMFATLLARLNPPRTGRSKAIAELCSGEHLAATQMLYDLSPCFKLSLIAANFAILEAVKDQPKIHIVDLDVGQGRQYDALIHALADRHRPPAVKITAVADPTTLLYGNYDSSSLSEVGGRIAKLAERAWGSVSPSSPGGRLSWTRRRLGTSPARPWLLTWRSSSRVWRTRAYRRRTPATSFSGVCALSARLCASGWRPGWLGGR